MFDHLTISVIRSTHDACKMILLTRKWFLETSDLCISDQNIAPLLKCRYTLINVIVSGHFGERTTRGINDVRR